MSDCQHCPVERECHYPYKPCDCFDMRKFWTEEQRQSYEKARRQVHNGGESE